MWGHLELALGLALYILYFDAWGQFRQMHSVSLELEDTHIGNELGDTLSAGNLVSAVLNQVRLAFSGQFHQSHQWSLGASGCQIHGYTWGRQYSVTLLNVGQVSLLRHLISLSKDNVHMVPT